jgi:hypothetical protein
MSTVAPAQRRLDTAFWLFVGAAVVGVLVALLGLTGIGAALRAAETKPGADSSTAAYVVAAVVVVIAFELAEALLFVVFARLARRRVGWARVGLVVLTVLALLGFSEGGYVLGLLRLALAAAGTVLVLTGPKDARPSH